MPAIDTDDAAAQRRINILDNALRLAIASRGELRVPFKMAGPEAATLSRAITTGDMEAAYDICILGDFQIDEELARQQAAEVQRLGKNRS